MTAGISQKQILSNPLAAYRSAAAIEDAAVVSRLTTLGDTYAELRQQRKAMQQQAKKLSRKIGEAKKQKQPTDSLKAAMKTQSALLADIETRLADTKQSILDILSVEAAADAPNPPGQSSPLIRKRSYRVDQSIEYSIRLHEKDLDVDAWNHYVAGNPAASTYHRAEWLSLIDKTFGHAGFYFSAHSADNSIVGILPLIRMKSRLFGDFLVSLPYFNYGGAVADSVEIEAGLIKAANTLAGKLGVEHVEYRDDIPRPDMPVRLDKVDMVLKLPATAEDLWAQFSAKLRSQIRRAQREAPTIDIGGSECVDDFYRVFSRNMRDLGTPVYSKSVFSNIIQTFPRESRIVVVKLDGRPVAAGFLIAHGRRMEIPWASTIRDFNHLSVNMILYWEVLKFAIEQGFQSFDFGRSSKDASTYRFKQQWGAEPEQLYWHYNLIKEQTIPSINPDNAKYALMINTWKKLPLAISQWLGPMIVRNIP